MPSKTYYVRTVYLDSSPPTWSADISAKKYRIRWYNSNPAEMYFETKYRKGDNVTKRRRRIKSSKWFGLNSIASVEYLRHEYVGVEGALRITIDVGLSSPNRDSFVGSVVEIKAQEGLDTAWIERLLPQPDEEFSKSKWALRQWNVKQS